MQYLAWRILCWLNRDIEISFLLVGHTKFAPDWCFGLLKQKFRKSRVGCLEDLASVVNQSAHTNHAQLVGKEDRNTIIQSFFRRGAFDGVFSSATPGSAKVRVHCNAEEKTLTLLKKDYCGWKPRPKDLPPILPPPVLTEERRKYLCEKIREFVPDQQNCLSASLHTSNAHPTTHTTNHAHP